MGDIKEKLEETMAVVRDYIWPMDGEQQKYIFDEDAVPTDPKLLFLKDCYTVIDKLIEEYNNTIEGI